MTSQTNKPFQVSADERYREAGFLRRQYCQSRATILSVSLTAIFAGGWLIIAEENLSNYGKYFVFGFCFCLYIISIMTSLYFSKRIQLVTAVLEALETGTYKEFEEMHVHANITKRLENQVVRKDVFDYSVMLIGLFAVILFMILFAEMIISTQISGVTDQDNITDIKTNTGVLTTKQKS